MNTSALIFMIIAQATVIAITVYFFVKSMRSGSKDQEKEGNRK